MNNRRAYHNIALIGFMGSGKSSVGQMIAGQLHFQFLDTDALIESRANKTISAIFAEEGESGFREREAAVVSDLTHRKNTVISTGGGLAVNPAHLESLKSHSLVVCLWASPEIIWRRVKNQTHRPLLQGPDPMKTICALLEEREPYYRQADVLINCDMRSIREVGQQVIHQFHQAQQLSSQP